MKPFRVARACIFAAALGGAAPALAHAFLDHAMPAVGSTLHQSPREIRLKFTEPLEPAFSKLRVQDAAGKSVEAGDSHLDASDPSILVVNVSPLSAGKYKVQWRVVSVDTHVTEGDYTFTIEP